MVNQTKLNEVNAYTLLQSLGNYLKTDIEVERGIIKRRVEENVPFGSRRQPAQIVEEECHNIKVTVSNTAPTEPNWPAVVFTGVGLACRDDIWRIISREMKHENRLKDYNEYTTKKTNADSSTLDGARRVDGKIFPIVTHDELNHGYCLYPGQSIVYEMKVLLSECSEVKDMNILVEGTISRRHLFHCKKEVIPAS